MPVSADSEKGVDIPPATPMRKQLLQLLFGAPVVFVELKICK